MILATAMLTAAGAYMARNFKLEVSSDQLLPKESPLRKDYQDSLETFGSDKIAAVYVRGRRTLHARSLETPSGVEQSAFRPR